MTESKSDRRFHNLTQEQLQTLDQVLTEVIPIHGRGNFPTLEVKPKDIIHVVKNKLIAKDIKVRDVRLNGSTASHVLVRENGTSYKDLDIIFGVELPKQEDFQIIKEVVLGCLMDFLPRGVNKDKITALTMKEAYVQKMVKVFTEHDRWSLISLSNNSGKNVELKFVNSLRRQFEFSVDSFQIILDGMLESYLETERREAAQCKEKEVEAALVQNSGPQPAVIKMPSSTTIETEGQLKPDVDMSVAAEDQPRSGYSQCLSESDMMQEEQLQHHPTDEATLETVPMEEVKEHNETVTQHTKEVKELNKTLTVDAKEVNETLKETVTVHMREVQELNETGQNFASQGVVEHGVEVEGKSMSISEKKTESSVQEIQINGEVSHQTEIILDTEPANAEPELKLEPTEMTCEPMQIAEKTTESMTVSEPCTLPSLPTTFLTQTTLESYIEYPLPPPAKKNTRSSQMVVLKHSSPKPPRKMSKKVTCVPHPPEKLVLKPPAISCQLLHPPKKDPKESIPMQVDLPGNAMNCLESSASQDKASQFKVLDTPTPAFTDAVQESDTKSEETHLQSQSPELPASSLHQTQSVQSSEPETGETNRDTNPDPKDQNTQFQPSSVKVPPPQPKKLKPIIHVNSQPVVQVDDLPALSPVPLPQVEEPAAQEDNITKPVLESPTQPAEPITQLSDPPSEVAEPLSTDPAIVSQVLKSTAPVVGLSVSPPQVLEPSVLPPEIIVPPLLPPQVLEPSLLPPQVLEPSGLPLQVLEPSILPPQVLEPPLFPPQVVEPSLLSPHVLDPSVLPPRVLEPPVLPPQVQEPSLLPPQVLEPSVLPQQVLAPPLLPPQVLGPSVLPPEPATRTEASQSLETSRFEAIEPPSAARELPVITVVAESMYGDFEQAMDHLRYRLIATRNPEEIRGGGLLKYSNLLVREFKPASETEIKTLERYMCSRFFIDFPDVNEQQRKIESYLRNHFIGEEKSKYDYLMTLRRVVNESTVCLMGHERRQTLNMITILALKVLGEQNIIPNTNNVTCYYQPAPYMADHNFNNYYIANGQSPLIYHPYPLHIHMQTGLV